MNSLQIIKEKIAEVEQFLDSSSTILSNPEMIKHINVKYTFTQYWNYLEKYYTLKNTLMLERLFIFD